MAKEFDITQWADFVRGQAEPEKAKEMAAQLEAGNESDLRAVAALERVRELADRDREHRVPAHALRVAKALGSLRRSAPAPSWLRTIALALTFDSASSPALAGTRDMQSTQRQLMFEGGDFSVDLSIEPGPYRSAVIVGQALRAGDQAEPLTETSVLVVCEDQVVGRSLTNAFGEFQASDIAVGNLSLRFFVDDDVCLEVPLACEFFED